jgi:hypothetical protein
MTSAHHLLLCFGHVVRHGPTRPNSSARAATSGCATRLPEHTPHAPAAPSSTQGPRATTASTPTTSNIHHPLVGPLNSAPASSFLPCYAWPTRHSPSMTSKAQQRSTHRSCAQPKLRCGRPSVHAVCSRVRAHTAFTAPPTTPLGSEAQPHCCDVPH